MDPIGHYDLPPDHGFELDPNLEKELPFDAVFHLSAGDVPETSVDHYIVDGIEYETTTQEWKNHDQIRLVGVCFGIIRTPKRRAFTSAIKLAVTSPDCWAGFLAICWFDSTPGASVPGVVEIRPVEEDPTG